MTIKEVIELCPEAAFVEVWEGPRVHTDCCRYVEEVDENKEAAYWELMDRERYDETILANSCVSADEIEDFDNGYALVILVND